MSSSELKETTNVLNKSYMSFDFATNISIPSMNPSNQEFIDKENAFLLSKIIAFSEDIIEEGIEEQAPRLTYKDFHSSISSISHLSIH